MELSSKWTGGTNEKIIGCTVIRGEVAKKLKSGSLTVPLKKREKTEKSV